LQIETKKIPVKIQPPHSPQVSIGMPIYNGELFIREALDSLLAQTFTDFELIISDNGSTDATEAICKEYAAKDVRIRYVRQGENRGAVANFWFVLNEAVGEYFMWAAADDRWDHEWISKLLPMVINRSCIAYGRLWTIDEYGHRISNPANDRTFKYTGMPILRRMKYFFEPPSLGKANPIYGLFPKKALTDDAFNVLNLTLHGADMLFIFNLLRELEVKPNKYVYLEKRIHSRSHSGYDGGSTTSTGTKRFLLYRILHVTSQILTSQKNKFVDYALLCNGFEKLILCSIFPFAIISDIGCTILNKYNRTKKFN
jgi:glycosyltransferase involved in cell wall biosynthesis